MKTIEQMLRNGITPEEIVNEINKAQKKIKEEDAVNKKIDSARTGIIVAFLDYLDVLGYGASNEKESIEMSEIVEKSLKDFEKQLQTLKILTPKTVSDEEKLDAFIKKIFR